MTRQRNVQKSVPHAQSCCFINSKSPVQTDATLLANNSQHCWMLRVASVCTSCSMSLCVLLGVFVQSLNWTVQTLSYVQTDATTPNIVGPAMLGVVASACTWLNYTYLLVRVGVNTDRLPLTPEKRFRPSTFLLSVLESVLKWWAFSDRFHRIRVYRRPN